MRTHELNESGETVSAYFKRFPADLGIPKLRFLTKSLNKIENREVYIENGAISSVFGARKGVSGGIWGNAPIRIPLFCEKMNNMTTMRAFNPQMVVFLKNQGYKVLDGEEHTVGLFQQLEEKSYELSNKTETVECLVHDVGLLKEYPAVRDTIVSRISDEMSDMFLDDEKTIINEAIDTIISNNGLWGNKKAVSQAFALAKACNSLRRAKYGVNSFLRGNNLIKENRGF